MGELALICRMNGQRMAVPVDGVAQVCAFDVAPIPLARVGVRGVGLLDDTAFVCVSIGGAGATGPAPVKGLLMKGGIGGAAWGVEIDAVERLAEVVLTGQPDGESEPWDCPTDWILGAIDSSGQPLPRLNPAAIARYLSEPSADCPAGGR